MGGEVVVKGNFHMTLSSELQRGEFSKETEFSKNKQMFAVFFFYLDCGRLRSQKSDVNNPKTLSKERGIKKKTSYFLAVES